MSEIVKDKMPRPGPEILGRVPLGGPDGPAGSKPTKSSPEAKKTALSSDRYSAKILNEVLEKLKEFKTPFERLLLDRLEGRTEPAQRLEAGQSKFLEKTEKAWIEFFQKFVAFTLTKTAQIGDLEAMIYRGLMKGAGEEPKGTLVSDLKFTDGKTDKFARLEVQGSTILEQLASRMPGDLLARALVAEWIGGPEFAYLALSHKVVNPDWKRGEKEGLLASAYRSPDETKGEKIREGSSQVSQGIALDARTEQLIAERLELNLGADLRTAGSGRIGGLLTGGKRRKGLFGGMFGESYDAGPVFVPWYQQVFHPRKFRGKVKWYVPLLYFVAVSAAGLFALYLFKFLMQGG